MTKMRTVNVFKLSVVGASNRSPTGEKSGFGFMKYLPDPNLKTDLPFSRIQAIPLFNGFVGRLCRRHAGKHHSVCWKLVALCRGLARLFRWINGVVKRNVDG